MDTNQVCTDLETLAIILDGGKILRSNIASNEKTLREMIDTWAVRSVESAKACIEAIDAGKVRQDARVALAGVSRVIGDINRYLELKHDAKYSNTMLAMVGDLWGEAFDKYHAVLTSEADYIKAVEANPPAINPDFEMSLADKAIAEIERKAGEWITATKIAEAISTPDKNVKSGTVRTALSRADATKEYPIEACTTGAKLGYRWIG